MAVITTLKERIQSYEDLTDHRLMPKLPVAIVLNGRSFRKATSLLGKPVSEALIELFASVVIKLAQEIDGFIAGYSFNDEIVIISRNDQTIDTMPWYDNKVQKIASAAASIATLEFNHRAKENNIPILGDAIFASHVFTVPSITEAINVLNSKQQQSFSISLYNACFYELLKHYNVDNVKQTLAEKTAQAKADILLERCGIDYNSYPLSYRRGVLCYRQAQTVLTDQGEIIKNKLFVNMELPIFAKEPEFLSNIFRK
jgi:tRNA(His) guanylyltransferase